MPANDMCDVIHYYFELDVLGEEEIQKAKAEMRKQLYGLLYERPYEWGSKTSSNHEFGTQEVGADSLSGAPELSHKPYIPPTPVNPTAARPYGTLVDAPLG